jgi:hypothetical protein
MTIIRSRKNRPEDLILAPQKVASISTTENTGLSVGHIGSCDHPIDMDDDIEDGITVVPEIQADVDEGVVA